MVLLLAVVTAPLTLVRGGHGSPTADSMAEAWATAGFTGEG
jgi:hypothetical protein